MQPPGSPGTPPPSAQWSRFQRAHHPSPGKEQRLQALLKARYLCREPFALLCHSHGQRRGAPRPTAIPLLLALRLHEPQEILAEGLYLRSVLLQAPVLLHSPHLSAVPPLQHRHLVLGVPQQLLQHHHCARHVPLLVGLAPPDRHLRLAWENSWASPSSARARAAVWSVAHSSRREAMLPHWAAAAVVCTSTSARRAPASQGEEVRAGEGWRGAAFGRATSASLASTSSLARVASYIQRGLLPLLLC